MEEFPIPPMAALWCRATALFPALADETKIKTETIK
jgi:hypothetical protein